MVVVAGQESAGRAAGLGRRRDAHVAAGHVTIGGSEIRHASLFVSVYGNRPRLPLARSPNCAAVVCVHRRAVALADVAVDVDVARVVVSGGGSVIRHCLSMHLSLQIPAQIKTL